MGRCRPRASERSGGEWGSERFRPPSIELPSPARYRAIVIPRALARVSLVFSSLVLGSSCGPFVILEPSTESETESASETESDGSTTAVATSGTTPPSTTTPATSTTTPPATTTTPATTSVDPTGDGPGYCTQACSSRLDCVPAGANPDDFACVDGFCEYVGTIPPCDPAACDDLMLGVCSEDDGVSVCTTLCEDDSMCIPGFTECTGTDDAGNSICDPIPCWGVAEGEPCEIEGFGQIGICIEGECACTDDSQCTAEGFGCNA
jgi:hypothetical protein